MHQPVDPASLTSGAALECAGCLVLAGSRAYPAKPAASAALCSSQRGPKLQKAPGASKFDQCNRVYQLPAVSAFATGAAACRFKLCHMQAVSKHVPLGARSAKRAFETVCALHVAIGTYKIGSTAHMYIAVGCGQMRYTRTYAYACHDQQQVAAHTGREVISSGNVLYIRSHGGER